MQLVTLCSIFPEEVWEMILERIGQSADMYNVIVGLPYLLQIPKFQRQKPKWMFAEVLPLLSEYLGIQGVLSCRLVCKQWDQTLHNFVSNHPCHQPDNEDSHNSLPINTTEVNQKCPLIKLATSDPVLHFRTADGIEHFMEISRNTKFLRDPVFGNTIYFDPKVNPNHPRAEFIQSSLAILTEFGNSVKHLILSSYKDFETPQQFYIRICNYIQRTPNLKSLSLLFNNQDDDRDLTAIVNVKPLPVLPFLQSLHIKTMNVDLIKQNSIMQEVIVRQLNVRKLMLEFRDVKERYLF